MNNYTKLIDAISKLDNSSSTKSKLRAQVLKAKKNGEVLNIDYVLRRLPIIANNIELEGQRKKHIDRELKKIINSVVCLETHKYAPELNKLHLINGNTIRTPSAFTIKEAAMQVITKAQ